MDTNGKTYDLEERTSIFAEKTRDYCLRLPKNDANLQYIPQLIRSGSSPAANYIEANETIGDKDFLVKAKTFDENQKKLRIGCD